MYLAAAPLVLWLCLGEVWALCKPDEPRGTPTSGRSVCVRRGLSAWGQQGVDE